MKSYHYALIVVALIAAYFIFRKKENTELNFIPARENPSKDSLLDGIADAVIDDRNAGGGGNQPIMQSMSFTSRQTVSMDGGKDSPIPSQPQGYGRPQFATTVDGRCLKRMRYYGSDVPNGEMFTPWQPC